MPPKSPPPQARISPRSDHTAGASVEWEAPAIVLSAAPYGESGVVAHVLSEEHGAYRGLVRGGGSRRQAGLWQTGNLVTARWFARLSEQLGTLTAELVHASAARILDYKLNLALLAASCAVADDLLPERQPHSRVFEGLLRLLTLLSLEPVEGARLGPAALIRWEAVVLADLGFGLDLGRCAVTGTMEDLAFVSPRSGRAVCATAASEWRDRLLPLPSLLCCEWDNGTAAQWYDGLRLTGHFLARDAFGQRNRPLPAARLRLLGMVEQMLPDARNLL